MIAAAYLLSRLTADDRDAKTADQYVESFLERCIDENGLFEWGNHRYYDVYKDAVVRFSGGENRARLQERAAFLAVVGQVCVLLREFSHTP